MIPKIIHYCWLSSDPYPSNIQKCMDSWKKYLPDYEFVHWNFERFPRGKSKWVDDAFDNKKYAFAADYIRLYALYNYGGIYLDTDVEVLKPFDELLALPYFIGMEQSEAGIEAATLGCEKGNNLIGNVLATIEGQDFIKSDGSFELTTLPVRFRTVIDGKYRINWINNIQEFNNDISLINVLPYDFFSPKSLKTLEILKSRNTYSIHHFAASWAKWYDRASGERAPKLKKCLGNRLGGYVNLFIYALQRWGILGPLRNSKY